MDFNSPYCRLPPTHHKKLILTGLRVLALTACERLSEKLKMLSDVKPRATVVLWNCQSGRESVTVDIGNGQRLRPVAFKEQGRLKAGGRTYRAYSRLFHHIPCGSQS